MATATNTLRAHPSGNGVRGRESLADVLRRRSTTVPAQDHDRTAAVQFSLGALTRNAEGAVLDVPLDELQPNPYQPRFQFNRQPLEELAQSLASEGQIEPAIARRVVRSGREALEIVAGARRLEAAKICNATIRPFPTLKVDIRELSDEEAERVSLIENLQRENLTPLEEGYRYWQLQQRDPRRWSVRAIADFVHKKKSSVQNRLGLIKDPAVAEAVLREQVPPTAGFHILRLPAPERAGYLRAAIAGRLTVEQIKTDVDRRLAPLRAPVAASPSRNGPALAGQPAEVAVKAHSRRRRSGSAQPAEMDEAVAARRAQLAAEREQLLMRIEELETQLAIAQSGLRAVERELAAL